MSNSLCWKCANCTSTEKCEFVNNINKYYRKNKNKFTKTGKVELLKDLQNYYINGTKTDNNGNIIFCPNFKDDELDHRSEAIKLKEYAKSLNICYSEELFKKLRVLDKFNEQMQKLSEKEKQAKQKKFVDSIILKNQKRLQQSLKRSILAKERAKKLKELKNNGKHSKNN